MLIFDAHLDMAWNALDWNRDLSLPVSEIRRFEQHFEDFRRGQNTVSWPELVKGRIGLIIATLLPRLHRPEGPLTFFQSSENAYAATRGQLAYYETLVDQGVLNFIKNADDLNAQVDLWQNFPEDGAEADAPPIGFILSMEGSWSVLSPEQIPEWYERGLRILGPAHYGPCPYCYGTGSEGGLTPPGVELLKQMQETDMLLDATHLSDQSFWEALEVYTGPVLASHHNCRALVPGDRQLTDDQIRALIERDAIIGAPFDCWMIQPGWTPGQSDSASVTMEDLVNHIDHICQLAGTAKHCGIGSDLDGGFGREQSPGDLDTIADLYKMGEILERRGYSKEDIEGILWKNWVDFFRRVWSND